MCKAGAGCALVVEDNKEWLLSSFWLKKLHLVAKPQENNKNKKNADGNHFCDTLLTYVAEMVFGY